MATGTLITDPNDPTQQGSMTWGAASGTLLTPPTGSATSLNQPANLTSDQVQQVMGAGQGKTVNIGGSDYGTVGVQTNDEGGQSYTPQAIVGYAAGTASQPNVQRNEYDLSGNFTKVGANMNGGSFNVSDFSDALHAAAFLGSFYLGGQGLAAMGAGSAGGIGGSGFAAGGEAAGSAATDTALAVQGNSINVLDAQTGVGYGSDAGSSLLTGPTEVNANYSLSSGGFGGGGVQTGPIEGNAAQGVNLSKASGEGLNFNSSGNIAEMGGGQGLTTSGSQVLGDSTSFINDPALNVPNAGEQLVTQNGIYTPQNPYTPDLGDPMSPINGGPNPWPAPPTGPLDWLKSLIAPSTTTGAASTLGSLSGLGTLGTLLTTLLSPKQPIQTPSKTSPDTPPQPIVGSGDWAFGNAQGGASGSLQGVAGTLLTSKDSFGYGRSMTG